MHSVTLVCFGFSTVRGIHLGLYLLGQHSAAELHPRRCPGVRKKAFTVICSAKHLSQLRYADTEIACKI